MFTNEYIMKVKLGSGKVVTVKGKGETEFDVIEKFEEKYKYAYEILEISELEGV